MEQSLSVGLLLFREYRDRFVLLFFPQLQQEAKARYPVPAGPGHAGFYSRGHRPVPTPGGQTGHGEGLHKLKLYNAIFSTNANRKVD